LPWTVLYISATLDSSAACTGDARRTTADMSAETNNLNLLVSDMIRTLNT
jgi:hypothetical protein